MPPRPSSQVSDKCSDYLLSVILIEGRTVMIEGQSMSLHDITPLLTNVIIGRVRGK